ncbi:unnamed protein product [Staurois parvus]|uniref:Uncharacterized protein n=1 Tax=Staurois parvus TaxID=386267 RepID=A0ABN9DSC2_9NEOB|nr:unnamed protein product [Staurois parvus]CAI9598892.1 unnamed protein product [Staurois parvus]
MVGVTSQGSNRRSQQRSGSGRVSNKSVRQEQEQDTGAHGKTHTKAQTAGLAIP